MLDQIALIWREEFSHHECYESAYGKWGKNKEENK